MSNRAKSELPTLRGFERETRIDLGLAIARCHARPGERMTREVLAEFCGCTDSYIFLIEQTALRKLRKLLDAPHRGQALREMLAGLFEQRRPAERKEAA